MVVYPDLDGPGTERETIDDDLGLVLYACMHAIDDDGRELFDGGKWVRLFSGGTGTSFRYCFGYCDQTRWVVDLTSTKLDDMLVCLFIYSACYWNEVRYS